MGRVEGPHRLLGGEPRGRAGGGGRRARGRGGGGGGLGRGRPRGGCTLRVPRGWADFGRYTSELRPPPGRVGPHPGAGRHGRAGVTPELLESRRIRPLWLPLLSRARAGPAARP